MPATVQQSTTLRVPLKAYLASGVCVVGKERWCELREIPGLEGYVGYRVSTKGRLQSTKVNVGGGRWVIGQSWRDIKPRQWGRGGYLQAALTLNGKQHRVKLHHLVLRAFVGPRPPGAECLHGDDNHLNNSVENLRWGTHRENAHDAIRNGVAVNPRGPAHGSAVLSESEAAEVIRRLGFGECGSTLAKQYGVHKSTIYAIKAGRIWKHLRGPANS